VKRVLSEQPEVRRAFVARDAETRDSYVLGVALDQKKVAAVGAAAALSRLQMELDLLQDVSLYAVELDADPTLEQQHRWHDLYARRQRWKGPLAALALVFLAAEAAVLALVTPGLFRAAPAPSAQPHVPSPAPAPDTSLDLEGHVTVGANRYGLLEAAAYAPSLDGLVRLHVRLMIWNRDTTKPPGPFAPMSVVGADGRHYSWAKLKRIRWRDVHTDVVWVRDVYLVPSAAAHGSKLEIGGRLLALHV
jgi:hypothetical protein